MTLLDVKNEDIIDFFATLGYSRGKKYTVVIDYKDEYYCRIIISGKGNLIYHCTLTHVGLHTLTNFKWVQFLFAKYGEAYREAFLTTIDDEMFFIQDVNRN